MRVIEPPHRRRHLYHVLEYLDGQTLRQWMEAHPQPTLAEARALLGQIARGLRAFHRLDMLHLDLKPENIHIDREGRVRIIDFGSVKIGGIAESASPVERTDLVGTKNYTAPELLLGESATTRCDLFSFGVIAYELLTGHLPYGERLGRETDAKALAKLHYIPARLTRNELPRWIDGALEKAVRLDPRQRYTVETEFMHDLLHANPEFTGGPVQPLIERNPLALWRVLALLSFALNMVLLFLLSRR